MSTLEALISGCLQGVTEFLPISSSGHLIILHSLFRLDKPEIAFDILLHVATTLAVIIFFRKDVMKLFTPHPGIPPREQKTENKGATGARLARLAARLADAVAKRVNPRGSTTQKNMALAVIIGSIPTALIGFKFKDSIESLFVRPKAVGFMFLITAAVLLLAALREKFSIPRKIRINPVRPRLKNSFLLGSALSGDDCRLKSAAFSNPERIDHPHTFKDGSNGVKEEPSNRTPSFIQAFLIGISQGVAIVPGISRSGLTISSGILLGIDANTAAKFSFLLSIPAVIGASLLKLKGIADIGSMHFIPAATGFLCAFLFGLVSLKVLLNMLSKGRLHIFALYCILAGIFVIIKF